MASSILCIVLCKSNITTILCVQDLLCKQNVKKVMTEQAMGMHNLEAIKLFKKNYKNVRIL